MQTVIVLSVLSLVAAVTAFGAASTPAESLEATAAHPYSQFFLVGGKQVDAATAIVQALNGREAFKCAAVVAKVSATGTSIGIKNVKKPRKN